MAVLRVWPTLRGRGVGTKLWWLALLACGGAYWPLAFEPSAMTSRHPYYYGGGSCMRAKKQFSLKSTSHCLSVSQIFISSLEENVLVSDGVGGLAVAKGKSGTSSKRNPIGCDATGFDPANASTLPSVSRRYLVLWVWVGGSARSPPLPPLP